MATTIKTQNESKSKEAIVEKSKMINIALYDKALHSVVKLLKSAHQNIEDEQAKTILFHAYHIFSRRRNFLAYEDEKNKYICLELMYQRYCIKYNKKHKSIVFIFELKEDNSQEKVIVKKYVKERNYQNAVKAIAALKIKK